MNYKDLTVKQTNVFRYLKSYTSKNGFQPSLRDMAEHFEYASTNSVSEILVRIADKGYIEFTSKARAIRVL